MFVAQHRNSFGLLNANGIVIFLNILLQFQIDYRQKKSAVGASHSHTFIYLSPHNSKCKHLPGIMLERLCIYSCYLCIIFLRGGGGGITSLRTLEQKTRKLDHYKVNRKMQIIHIPARLLTRVKSHAARPRECWCVTFCLHLEENLLSDYISSFIFDFVMLCCAELKKRRRSKLSK